MGLYRSLKEYFTRGIFWGLGYDAHLHVKKPDGTAVLTAYNFTSRETRKVIDIEIVRYGIFGIKAEAYNGKAEMIPCASVRAGGKLRIETALAPLSAAIIVLK